MKLWLGRLVASSRGVNRNSLVCLPKPCVSVLTTCGFCSSFHTERPKSNQLKGKVALVTGSTGGIGLGLVQGLSAAGCDVLYNGFADDKTLREISSSLQRENQRSSYVNADLSNSDDVMALVDAVQSQYPLGVDILINNAGFQHVSNIENFSLERWQTMLNLMLTAPFMLIQSLLPDMRRKGWGRIINIASAHAHIASPNKSGYVTCKHGMVGLTKVVALETATSGITCNAICPGYVNTPLFQKQVHALSEKKGITYEAAKVEFLSQFHATAECVDVDHVTDLALYMCSESANQMTGSAVIIDGGWTSK